MARTTGKPDPIDPMIPRVKERVPIKIPTIDQLMWPAQPRPWWELLPPPPPSKDPSPYAPVPMIPPPPAPEWPFGPPFLAKDPALAPGPSHAEFVPRDSSGRLAALQSGLPTPIGNSLPSSDAVGNGAPPIPYLPLASQQAPRGLPALLEEIGAFDSLNPEAWPSGGLPGLIREYLRNR